MPKLYTIGHSNHPYEVFLEMLLAYKIKLLVDVRTIPKSRHVPWSNKEKLIQSLKRQGIQYIHQPGLGGLRHPVKNSINDAWHNKGFQGFADYMQTEEFFNNLKELNKLLKTKTTAIMCAEAVPWRCHRSLIADAETVRKIIVEHIMSPTKSYQHALTDFAVVDRKTRPIKIYYPTAQTSLKID